MATLTKIQGRLLTSPLSLLYFLFPFLNTLSSLHASALLWLPIALWLNPRHLGLSTTPSLQAW